MKHKAISINQPHANLIVTGQKTAELRPIRTTHRGDIIICSTKKKYNGSNNKDYKLGMAIGIVEIFDCVEANEIHRNQIYPDKQFDPGQRIRGYVWKLRNPRVINPFPVKGQQGFYYLDVDMDKLDPEPTLNIRTIQKINKRPDVEAAPLITAILFIALWLFMAAAVIFTLAHLFAWIF